MEGWIDSFREKMFHYVARLKYITNKAHPNSLVWVIVVHKNDGIMCAPIELI